MSPDPPVTSAALPSRSIAQPATIQDVLRSGESACSSRCELHDVGAAFGALRGAKAECFVQPRSRGILRTQAKIIESASRGVDYFFDQAPAHAEASRRNGDIEVAHPADTLVGGIRIDVEPTHADQSSVDPGSQQHFTRPIESIRAAGPLVDERSDEP